ncbi:MAG TPA: hemolysin family protein [Candidatus Acidoferrales bacterium]|nr:hemolysin family protein [Candidatus Acidoferrales bacterium]
MIVLQFFGILCIIAINAFFAAVEFSLVAVRHSRVRQLIEHGDPRARVVESLLADMGTVVSGVQVGITLTSLALGYFGELTLAKAFAPLLTWIPGRYAAVAAHASALAAAFILLTILQVVLGELVPKGLSLAHAERIALLIARPFRWFLKTFRWAIMLLDGVAEGFVRALGVKAPQSHTAIRSAEELRILVEQAGERGVLEPAEQRFIHGAMNLGQVEVREIMVPRPDMHALPANAPLEDVMKMFAVTQRSRLPVYESTLDHVAGFVHIKDIIWVLLDRSRRAEEGATPSEFSLQHVLREVIIVPETKLAIELLLEFRAKHTGLAMVVDEFGTILGLVTLEDILEEMVGEIHDEFDVVEQPLRLADGSMIFDASLKVRDLGNQFQIELPDDSAYETLAGFVLSHLGFLPRGGESFEAQGYRFTIVEMDRRRIARVKIKQIESASLAPSAVEKGSGTHPATIASAAVPAVTQGAAAKRNRKVSSRKPRAK